MPGSQTNTTTCNIIVELPRRKKLKDYLKKPPQTILHGDFHGGNHMYGEDENAGKVVALDYQFAGTGRVVVELFYFLNLSFTLHNLEDVMDVARQYHDSLVELGVKDYSWKDFEEEIEMMMVDYASQLISNMTWSRPKHIKGFTKAFGEKGAEFEKVFESGFYYNCFIFLTSMYLKDKNNFLIVDEEK